jgi:hypothetical protein
MVLLVVMGEVFLLLEGDEMVLLTDEVVFLLDEMGSKRVASTTGAL